MRNEIRFTFYKTSQTIRIWFLPDDETMMTISASAEKFISTYLDGYEINEANIMNLVAAKLKALAIESDLYDKAAEINISYLEIPSA